MTDPIKLSSDPLEALDQILKFCREQTGSKPSDRALYSGTHSEKLVPGLQAMGRVITVSDAFSIERLSAGDFILLKSAIGFVREIRDTESRKTIAVTGEQASKMYERAGIPSSHDVPVIAKLRGDFSEAAILTANRTHLAGHRISDEDFVFHTTVATTDNQATRIVAGDVLLDIVATHPWMKELAKGQDFNFADVKALREKSAAAPNETIARHGIGDLVAKRGADATVPTARA